MQRATYNVIVLPFLSATWLARLRIDIQCIYLLANVKTGVRMAKDKGEDAEKPPRKKKKSKDAQLIIRIGREDRDRFVELCEDLDTSAAREIRQFISKFVAKHKT